MSDYQDPEVLGWVNTIREKDGRKPLKRISYARREEGRDIVYPTNCNCPIAVSLVDYTVTKNSYYPQGTPWERGKTLPFAVRDWIETFDQEQEEEMQCLS